ncbi:uncharacterized protein LOC109510023 [Hippocampus comes]|uniref:uncharacterized protein LOC109510023 n=1 Tax=Hippocampus comes TaxID=109280 RepID=UPI00094E04CB|nr:PREDICTED: uncharacterized protein LOC109510023 [Hippocampus comes]
MPPSRSSCQGYDPLNVFSDVDEERQSKSLSLSPRDEQDRDATPPSRSSCRGSDPLNVSSDVDEKKRSKSLSLSPRDEQYRITTPPSRSSCQGSDPLNGYSDVEEEKRSKSLSSSPRDEQYRDATPPSRSSCRGSYPLNVDEGKRSKSLSLSPRDELCRDAKPPSRSSSRRSCPLNGYSDEDEEKASKSLSLSPSHEQYSDATPPSTFAGQQLEPLEVVSGVDEEKPSQSFSLSPSLSTGHGHLDVDSDLVGDKISRSLSPSILRGQKGDGTPPLTSTQGIALVEVDSDLEQKKTSKSLSPSQLEDQKRGETPPELDFLEVDAEQELEIMVSKSLSSSPREENSSGRSPKRDLVFYKDSTLESKENGSHSSVCSKDGIQYADKPDSSSLCQEFVSVGDNDDGGVILRERVSSKSSTRSSPNGEQNEDLCTLVEDHHKDSTPEHLKPKSGSQASSPTLVCLDVDIQAAPTYTCEASVHQLNITSNEDMASKLSPSPSKEQYAGVIPGPTTTCEEFRIENTIKTSPHDETLSLQELSQNTSSVSPSCTQALITEATDRSTYQEVHVDDDSVLKHQTEEPSKPLKHSLPEVTTSVPQILEKYFSDAMKACSNTIFQALLNQVVDYSDAMKEGRVSIHGEDLAQSKTHVITPVEQEGDSPAKLLGHESCHQPTTTDILEEPPENSMAAPHSAENQADFTDILSRRQMCKVHPIATESQDDSEHPCPHHLFEVPEDEKTIEATKVQSTTKENNTTSSPKPLTAESKKNTKHKLLASKRTRKLKKDVVHSSALGLPQLPVPETRFLDRRCFKKVRNFFARMKRRKVCPEKSTIFKEKMNALPKVQEKKTKISFFRRLWKKIWRR